MLDSIELGRVYVYTNDLPKGCRGAHYKAHRRILDVPSYQWKILVEALDGRDKGLWFCCTPANFRVRYKLLENPTQQEMSNDQSESGSVVDGVGTAT